MSEGSGRPAGRRPSHATVVAYLALFVALGGTAWAAATIGPGDIERDAVRKKHIRDGAVRTEHVKNRTLTGADVADEGLTGDDVADDSLTGDDIAEETLQNVDAATFAGKPPTGYLTSSVYLRERPVGPGTLLANGYYSTDISCDPGDLVLNGGPVSVSAPSVLVNSTGGTTFWSVTIDKRGGADTFGVSVRCLDQTP